MKHVLKNHANPLIFLIMVLTMFTTAFSASAAITKEEWAKLMQDAEFKAADQKLGAAYKQAMAALPEANKQKLIKEQRAWVSKREHDAFAKFSKGTLDYKRFLIDKANERIAELQNIVPKAVQTVKFNNKTIPITIFYHAVPAGEIFGEGINLDSLVFTYDNTKQALRLKPVTIFYQVEEGDSFNPLEVDVDYNFDGHMDIAFVSQRGNTAEWRQVYIYDPKTKSYAFQEVLSEQPNLWPGNDLKKQTLYSHINSGHAGMIYASKEFKWKNGRLTLILEENQDYDNNLDKYTRITRTLQNDKWIEQRKTVTAEDMQ